MYVRPSIVAFYLWSMEQPRHRGNIPREEYNTTRKEHATQERRERRSLRGAPYRFSEKLVDVILFK